MESRRSNRLDRTVELAKDHVLGSGHEGSVAPLKHRIEYGRVGTAIATTEAVREG
jgi:hypothetical protein